MRLVRTWSAVGSLLFLLLARAAYAQEADIDSIAPPPPPPDLSGTWRLSQPVRSSFTPVQFTQDGIRLQADIVQHVRCMGRDMIMRIMLNGYVQGREVQLRATSSEIQGGYGDACHTAAFAGQEEFRGTVSPDGKKIVGPYDASGTPLHVWTFKR